MAQRGPTKYELRPAVQADGQFFYRVKRQVLREAVVSTFGAWDEERQREKFFANFVPSTCHVLMVEGRDAGMLAVDREADPIYVGGIYLLAEFQRQGLGAAIMREVMGEAAARGRDVHLQVLLGNPLAKRFYERLGFQATERSDSHTQMRWRRGR